MNQPARGRRGNRVATVPWNSLTHVILCRKASTTARAVLRGMFSPFALHATVRLPNFEFPLAVLAQLRCRGARD
jgi:hypothetical protein